MRYERRLNHAERVLQGLSPDRGDDLADRLAEFEWPELNDEQRAELDVFIEKMRKAPDARLGAVRNQLDELTNAELWRLQVLLNHCDGGIGEPVIEHLEERFAYMRRRPDMGAAPPTEADLAEAAAFIEQARVDGLIGVSVDELARVNGLLGG